MNYLAKNINIVLKTVNYLLVFRLVRIGVDILAFLTEAGVLAETAAVSVSVKTEAESFFALDAVGFMKLRLELALPPPALPPPMLRLLLKLLPMGRFVLLDILSVAEEVTTGLDEPPE